jgi:hypothetical protein
MAIVVVTSLLTGTRTKLETASHPSPIMTGFPQLRAAQRRTSLRIYSFEGSIGFGTSPMPIIVVLT